MSTDLPKRRPAPVGNGWIGIVVLLAALSTVGRTALAQSAPTVDSRAIPCPLPPNSPPPSLPVAPRPAQPLMPTPLPCLPISYPVGPTAEQDSVLLRPRPEYQAEGIELDRLLSAAGALDRKTARDHSSGLSSFRVFPRLDIETEYQSNLFRDSSSVSDVIFVARPSLAIRSDWASHALEFVAGGAIGRHADTGSEDYEDVFGRVTGRAEWRDDLVTGATAQIARTHQQRGTLADPGDTAGVIEIETAQVGVGAAWDTGILTLSGEFQINDLDYVSTAQRDLDDFDRTDRAVQFRASWEFDEGTSVFVQPRYYARDYRRRRDQNGLLQDNEGAEILAGLTWNASGVTFAEFGVGYLRQTFDEPTIKTISGPSFNGRAVWNATDLTTITLNLKRSIEETNSPGFAGVFVTSLESRIDHEFLYNTIMSLRFDYAREDYDSNPRSDDRIGTALEVRHLFNEYFFAGAEVGYENLSSNSPGESFRNVHAAIRIGTQI